MRWFVFALALLVIFGNAPPRATAQIDTALPKIPVAEIFSFIPPYALQTRGSSASGISPEEQKANDAPSVTMLPHPTSVPYWISGQANIIFQGRLPFHSPYQGPNSFHGSGEYKTSLIGTLFLGYQPHHNARYNTDLILDFESAGGRGLSQALGLAGFTNLDVVRNPNLGSKPYLSRYQIHQTIGLTAETTEQIRGPFALASEVPVRRFDLRIGKMTMADYFDLNAIGSDSHLQFTNWTIDNNGAWDYAADTRGYTIAGIAEYQDRHWALRYAIAAMPVIANGIDLDWAFSRARGQNGEFEIRHSLIHGREGITRLLVYGNTAHMGVYREAVGAYLAGIDKTPVIAAHEHFGSLKYGLGLNCEQGLTQNLRLFGRFGWNEGQHESFAYTEVDQTFVFGADLAGVQWNRPVDKLGLAVVTNAIKKDHQNYLRHGGLGFLIGDGRLNYGRETIVETYYTTHLWRGFFSSAGLSLIANPGYNKDRGPAWVPGTRVHIDF